MRHGFLVVYCDNNNVKNYFDTDADSVTAAFLRFEDKFGIDKFPLINIIQIR